MANRSISMVSSGKTQSAQYRSNLQNSGSSSSPAAASYYAGNHLNLKGTMSKKSIDEVWNDIVEQERVNRRIEKETRVADFLMNVGKQEQIDERDHAQPPLMAVDPMVMVSSHSQQTDWLNLEMQMQMQQMQMQIPSGGMNMNYPPDLSVCRSASEMRYSEISNALPPLEISLPMTTTTTCSSESRVEGEIRERKRPYSDEMMEKSVERRQKRMIKNRESAARSRARKQEYTKNLEENKDRLQQANCWLKKIKVHSNPFEDDGDIKCNICLVVAIFCDLKMYFGVKDVEKKRCHLPTENLRCDINFVKEVEAQFTEVTPRYQLRRTSSATF